MVAGNDLKLLNLFNNRYQKRGKGALVKCLEDRIKKDYTNQDLLCPRCGTEFARLVRIKGRRAHKIIGGKVYHSS